MTKQEIQEGNKLITEFIECKKDKNWENWYKVPKKYQKDFRTSAFGIGFSCEFHCSWNWLMPVIKKILEITVELDEMEMYYSIIDQIPHIEQVFYAVVEFIKWYNNERKS